MVPEKQSFTITEGGSAKFECQILYGQEVGIEWSWNRNGTDIDPIVDEAIKITSNETHSVMTINKVTESHKGDIFCVATNKFGSHSSKFTLRVKDILAALWPILAIVAEVFILCVIILIYEKKCNKKPHTTGIDNEQSENL